MNENVTRIVNLLFQDTALSEEVQALRDEVLNNCQERFADLIASGLSEEESLAAVAESLKGMDEVLKEYPRKAEAPRNPAATEEEEPEEAEDRAPSLSHFSPDQIQAIDAQLASGDLEVYGGEGNECTLEVTGDLRMRLEEDGTLRLWQERPVKNIFREINWEDSITSFEQLGNTLNRLGQNLSRFISQGLKQEIQESRAVLKLPAYVHPTAFIRTTSGEIIWRDLIPGKEMILRTTSGDIDVQMDLNETTPRVEISTMSGDANLCLSAESLKVSSVSGDLFWRGEAGSLTMSTTSGDVDAAGTLSEAALNTTSGDLSLELKSADPAEIRANSVSGDVELRLPHGLNKVDTAMKTVSGEIRMRGVEQTAGAPVRLRAQTVSGDLKIYA